MIKCAVLYVALKPSDELLMARQALMHAATADDAQVTHASSRPWFPHLSLCTKNDEVSIVDIIAVTDALNACGIALPQPATLRSVSTRNVATGTLVTGEHVLR